MFKVFYFLTPADFAGCQQEVENISSMGIKMYNNDEQPSLMETEKTAVPQTSKKGNNIYRNHSTFH